MIIASFRVNTDVLFPFRASRHLEQVLPQSAVGLILLDVLEDVDLALELIYSQRRRPSRRLLQQWGLGPQGGLWCCRRFVFIPFRHLQKLVKVILYPTGENTYGPNVFKTMATSLTFSAALLTWSGPASHAFLATYDSCRIPQNAMVMLRPGVKRV